MTSPNGKGKNNSKNNIQAVRHDKFTTNTNDTIFENDSTNHPPSLEWTTETGKRNLSDSSNPDPNKKSNKLFITANRYELLAQTESAKLTSQPNTLNTSHCRQNQIATTNFCKRCNKLSRPVLLIEIIGVDNFFYKFLTYSLKIQTINPESYRILIHFLKKAQYYTFQLKSR